MDMLGRSPGLMQPLALELNRFSCLLADFQCFLNKVSHSLVKCLRPVVDIVQDVHWHAGVERWVHCINFDGDMSIYPCKTTMLHI